MKKLTFIFAIAILFAACQNTATKTTVEKSESTETLNVEIAGKSLSVDEVQEQGYDFVGKEVVVSGTVSHVCRHSGQRCFLMGSTEDITIKVEAGKKIGSFTQEQMGSDLKVTGTLHEIRIDDAYIAEMKAEAKKEGDGHNCNAGTGRIAGLREKIEKSERGYYSIFYLEGEKYETIN